MIGDNHTDDILGAKRVGLGAIGVHPRAPMPEADAVCETLTDLLALLR